jgi:hypothetical protein
MDMGQFFPSGYGYGFVCPLGTLPTAIPMHPHPPACTPLLLGTYIHAYIMMREGESALAVRRPLARAGKWGESVGKKRATASQRCM